MSDKITYLNNVTRAVIAPTEMTLDQAVEMINAKHSRVTLKPEDIYAFRMILSSQATDSYHTKMSGRTLQNYAEDFAGGQALMNSHRGGSIFGPNELPIGRSFNGLMTGTPLSMTGTRYEDVGNAQTIVDSYLQRGLKVTDVGTDDLIRGIDGGTINDVSVGFTLLPDGSLVCSLCGSDLRDWESCTHIPGRRYDNGRCFGWVDNAHGREASLVYGGSNPDAMIQKAIRMVEVGQLSRWEALEMEDEYGVRIVGDKTFAVAKPETRKDVGMDWEKLISTIRAVDATLAEKLAGADEAARADILGNALKGMRSQIEALQPRADLGDKWLADLVDQTVKMRVRAEGDKFDTATSDKYRKFLLASNDPDYIKQELAAWERSAKAVLGDGKRQTGIKAAEAATPPRRPSRAYRG